MGKPYSMNLRERVVSAVEREGLSQWQVTARFGVSDSAAIAWVGRFWSSGSAASGKMGGHRLKKIAGTHRDWLVGRCRERAFKRLRGGRSSVPPATPPSS